MKNLMLSLSALLFAIGSQGQNTNTKAEVKTVTTTIKDSKGEKKIVKSEEIKEVQNIELEEAQPNTLNIPMKESPVAVTTKTKVMVDGETKSEVVNHSAYYSLGGANYQIKSDKMGYVMTSPNSKNLSLLRKTSNNNYIFKNKDKFSVGYFDASGNLILETYDEKTDSVILEKYTVVKP
ncbi:hypothetical protein [Flavobacterium phycosphaerae]|uniref:hypothetical protein n=1 Tax=Flavobacterium phycosphaerae TaxID=2697515 RepID=UPI00138A04A9|nr:hypothetical protein [Flavobacterium phycosphaerae]